MSSDKQENEISTVTFATDCTIYQAAILHDKLLDSLGHANVVTLDVSAIETVDASFMQLLAATQIEAAQTDKTIKIVGTSAALNDLAETMHCQIALDNNAIRETLEVTSK